jgi:hypothetical protein
MVPNSMPPAYACHCAKVLLATTVDATMLEWALHSIMLLHNYLKGSLLTSQQGHQATIPTHVLPPNGLQIIQPLIMPTLLMPCTQHANVLPANVCCPHSYTDPTCSSRHALQCNSHMTHYRKALSYGHAAHDAAFSIISVLPKSNAQELPNANLCCFAVC